jgi:hypothetical protein
LTRVSLFLIGLFAVLGVIVGGRLDFSSNTSASPGQGILFGTDAGAGVLIQVSTVSGVGTVVGPMGFPAPALSKSPISGILYAGSGGSDDTLYTVNPVNGNSIPVGGSTLGSEAFYGGMDFDNSGVLYATMNLAGGTNTGSDYLVTVNTGTGQATVVGPFGVCTGNSIPHNAPDGSCTLEGMEAIAFDSAGNLWGALNVRGAFGTPGLYTINKLTGQATFVNPISDGAGHPSGGVVTLQFACDGTLYGGSARRTGGNVDGGFLGTINTGSGAWSFVGGVPATSGNPANSLGGLAFDTTPCPTPTPSPTPTPTSSPTPTGSPTPTTGPETETPVVTGTPGGGTPVSVGGIAGLQDVSGAPRSESAADSRASLALVILAGGGMLVLGGVSWLATRRTRR